MVVVGIDLGLIGNALPQLGWCYNHADILVLAPDGVLAVRGV
jgi:hypothetical protein